MKISKCVYLPLDLVEKVNMIIEKYSSVLRIRNFSEATEDALRKWVAWIQENEDRLKRIMKEMEY